MKTTSQSRYMNSLCIRLYNRIVAFIKQYGYPPTLREICTLMDINSTSQARDYLRVLEGWNWIVLTDGKARTMRLIRPTEIDVPPAIRQAATLKADQIILRRLTMAVKR